MINLGIIGVAEFAKFTMSEFVKNKNHKRVVCIKNAIDLLTIAVQAQKMADKIS